MRRLVILSATVCAAVALPALADSSSLGNCHIGAYRLADSSVLDIAASEGDTLRWRRFDGTTGALHEVEGGSWNSTFGWTDRPDGKVVSFGPCEAGEIHF